MSLEARKTEYNTHRANGLDYYDELRADYSIQIENQTMTLEDGLEALEKLECALQCIMNGDWKSGLHELGKVLPNKSLSQAEIDGVKSDVQDYITNNYSW